MKRILAAVMAVSMLMCMGGCGNNKEAAPEATDVSAAQAAEETTAEETSAAGETEAQTQAAPEGSEGTEGSTSASTLTAAAIKKLNEWKDGNIIIEAEMNQDDSNISFRINKYDKKLAMDMNLVGMFTTKTISDGTNTYMINDSKKTYCISSETSDESPVDDMLIDDKYAADAMDTGKETVEGKEYTYEEFEENDNKFRYYFNDNGDMCYAGSYQDDKLVIMKFTMTFLDAPDESVFAVPEGYTEISEEDMAMQLFEDMFGALGELSEGEDSETDDSSEASEE